MINEKIGTRIREARKKKGISAKQLAKIIDMSVQMLSHWETGKRLPTFEKAAEIAQALNVSVAYIYCLEEEKLGSNTNTIPYVENSQAIKEEKADSINIPDQLFGNFDPKTSLAIKIPDESMEPIFRKNDIAIIQKRVSPIDGSFVLLEIQTTHQVLFRQYKIDNSNIKHPKIYFHALNSKYNDIEHDDDIVKIIGVCMDNTRLIN